MNFVKKTKNKLREYKENRNHGIMLNIRKANAQEAELLTKLAIRSEAYWCYDSTYMKKFQSMYAVTENFISNNPTFVLEDENEIVGFYGILINKEETSLEYLFIEPRYIGHGYGKRLWNHAIESGRTLGLKEFVIVTSPQAKDFYLKLGAIHTGEIESLVKRGRMIPRFIYSF
jgi:N-acetylglutamate synthase-like GNAT family acetyltransferase